MAVWSASLDHLTEYSTGSDSSPCFRNTKRVSTLVVKLAANERAPHEHTQGKHSARV